MDDDACIAIVRALRHRTGARHDCRCEECRAIVHVCALAREAIAMKAARRRPRRVRPVRQPSLGDA